MIRTFLVIALFQVLAVSGQAEKSISATEGVDPALLEVGDKIDEIIAEDDDPGAAAKARRQNRNADIRRARKHSQKGGELYGRCRYDGAIREWKQALSVLSDDPIGAKVHADMAAAYSKKKDHSQAIHSAEKSVTLDPKCAYCSAILGLVLIRAETEEKRITEYRKGALEGALGRCERAIELDKEEWWGSYCKGRVLSALGSLGPAIEAYRSAAAMRPKNSSIRLKLAEALDRNGDREESINSYRSFLKLAKSSKDCQKDIPKAKKRLQALNSTH